MARSRNGGRRKSRAKTQLHWNQFEQTFNELHPNFFANLAKKHLKLSQQELHLCAMIRSGMMSYEIADQLGISERTVENHRTNIRRKLGLTNAEQELANFLMRF
jgi:AraC family transcriptional regulator, chitin signaling transcriptional activator